MGNALDIARLYTRIGWRVVPISFRTKRPPMDEWNALRLDAVDLPQHFNGAPMNVGVLLGEPSHWLVDIDLDVPEASELAPQFLEQTLTFGRGGKPVSHYLYRSENAVTDRRFHDVTKSADGKVIQLLELRSTGGQTVFPGSTHPTGEAIDWSSDVPDSAELAALVLDTPYDTLHDRVRRLAVATLLVRNGYAKANAIAWARGRFEELEGLLGDQVRRWLGVERMRPATAPPATSTSPDFDEAVRRWNAAHFTEWPKNSGHCPGCGHDGCFGAFPPDAARWACFSTAHPDGIGIIGNDMHHGDALDLEAARRGATRAAILRDDGYLAPRPTPQSTGARIADAPSPPRPMPHAEEAARDLWGKPLPPAVPTGLAGLDRALGGLRAEGVNVVNGPPGRGKSGLVIQVARYLSEKKEVVYLSSELSARQVIARTIAQIRGVPWLRIFELGPSESESIARDLHPLALRVIELRHGPAVVEILDRVAQASGQAPICVLDYMQHAARRLGMDDPRLAVGRLADQIGAWALDTRSVALVVSSVARLKYDIDDDTTTDDLLSAGKEAGEIEYDASTVLFLATDKPPLNGSAPAKIFVCKNRFGAAGQKVGLVFDGGVGMFRDDPLGALTDLESQVFKAIADGARTKNEVFEKVGGKRNAVLRTVDQLMRNEVVEGPPLRPRRAF